MEKLIYKQFELTASHLPDTVALAFRGEETTYQQLNHKANQIAHYLGRYDAKDKVVMVAMPSSSTLVTSLLGTFKAGGIYLPVDLTFAESRLQFIFEESPEALILISESQTAQWAQLSENLYLAHRNVHVISEKGIFPIGKEESLSEWETLSNSNPEIAIDPESDSYIFYTSGSTGKPKAIVGIHKSLAQFIEWESTEFQVSEGTRVSQLTQFTFDASLRDIFLPLATGGTLCIPSLETRSNITELTKWIGDEKINIIHTVPSLFQHITKAMEQSDQKDLLPELKHILLAGEPLYAKHIQRWNEAGGTHVEVVNFYGATETTMIKTFHRIKEVPATPGQILHVGQPIEQAFTLVLNQGRLCRIGEIGEVYIKTPNMTRGYYNNPDLTKEVFVQNPLIKDKEDIIYKTGDLGRYLPDRSLEILGRRDRQVKINGVRIELNEIDQAVLAIPGVEETYVNTIKDADGNPQIICYYKSPEEIEDIRTNLEKSLNAYVLPSYVIHLEDFPLNANGKIDKKALPTPEEVILGKDFKLPKEGTETQIANIWKKELKLQQIGRDHTFYQVGGNSLRAMKIAGDIQQEMGLEIKLTDLFVYPTIARLAEFLDTKASKKEKTTLLPAPKMASYPLSHTQKRLWIISKLKEASLAYHIPVAYEINGKVNVDALEQALSLIIARHESLRTVFREEGDEPRQVILPAADVSFNLLQEDVSGMKADEIQERIEAFRDTPFAMHKEPLFRAALFTKGEECATLCLVMHHIISDGWSVSILLKDTLHAYEEITSGSVPAFNELKLQYKDYAVWQQNRANDQDLKEGREFWHNKMDGELPVLELPTDFPRPAIKTFNGALAEHLISSESLTALKELCSQQGNTLFQGIYSVVYTLLARYTGQKDVIIGTPVANRTEPELQETIGFFANTVPLRMQFDLQGSFNQLLSLSKNMAQEAFDQASYPFDKLIEELKLQRELSRSPLFDVMMVLHRESTEGGSQQVLTEANETAGYSKFDLTFSFKETPEGLVLKVEYNTDLFSQEKISRICHHIGNLAHQLVHHPETSLAKIDFLTDKEKTMLRKISNLDTLPELPETSSMVEQMQKQVNNNPHKVAIYSASDNSTITYQELDDQSSYLAAYLLNTGKTTPKGVIGISSRRHHNGFIAMFAALKAGLTYVFLEANLPEERRQYIIQNAGIDTLLAEDITVTSGWPVKDVFSIKEGIEKGRNSECPEVVSNPLAYIIYTSGSTGEPKGVMITHQSVISMIEGIQRIEHIKIEPEDRSVTLSSFSFDMVVHDVYGYLFNGASVIILDQEKDIDIQSMEEAYARYEPTRAAIPTALFNAMVDFDFKGFNQLRLVLTGGEAASVSHFSKFAEKYDTYLYNVYGPTENTVYSTFLRFDKGFVTSNIPIGKPIDCISATIRDQNGQLAALGTTGELWLGGHQLSYGYNKNEELYTQKFIRSEESDGIVYRTGDLCRWTEDGNIQYMGRVDDMLKIRGFLVETQEIVNTLLNNDSVHKAVVLPRKEENGTILVAYLVGSNINQAAIRTDLRKHLPSYMLPKHIIELDYMPANKNGKIDRKKLHELPLPESSTGKSNSADLSEAELLIAELWTKILKKESIGADDNFYELGGDSIKAIQFIAHLRIEGYKLTIKQFMHGPTVSEVANNATPISRNKEQAHTMADAIGQVPLSPVISHFFDTVTEPFRNHFNQSVKIYHPEGFDKEAITKVLQLLIAHHPVLRSRFTKTGSNEWQHHILEKGPEVDIPLYDLRNQNNSEEIFIRQANVIQAGMSIEKGQLLRAGLFRDEDGDTLLIAIHHLVVDGISWRIIFEDLGVLYRQILECKTPSLPEDATSFRQYIKEQQNYIASEDGKVDIRVWESMRTESPARIEVEFPQQPNTVSETASASFSMTEKETTQLQEVAGSMSGLEINHVMMAALGLTLNEQFGTGTYPVTLEGHGREELTENTDLSRTLGWFTSLFPVALPSGDGDSSIAYITQVRDLLRQIPLKGASYGVARYLSKEADHLPKMESQVSFNFLGQFESDIEAGEGGQMEIHLGEKGAEVHPLMERFHEFELSGFISNGQLHFSIRFGKNRWSSQTIQNFADLYSNTLKSLLNSLNTFKANGYTELSFNQSNFYSGRQIVGNHSEIGPTQFKTLDKEAFIKAVTWLQERHTSLRSHIVPFNGSSFSLSSPYKVPINWIEAESSTLDELTKTEMARLRDVVDTANPWAISVVQAGADNNSLMMVLSHLFFDGYSQGVLQKEIDMLYQVALKNETPELALPASQYSDYVKAQKDYLGTRNGLEDISFWKLHLKGQPFKTIDKSNKSIRATILLDQETANDLDLYLEKKGVSPAAFFLSIMKTLMAKGKEDGVIAVPVSMRGGEIYDTVDNENSIGFYTNILLHPFSKMESDDDFIQKIDNTQQQFADELRHVSYPYELLMKQLDAPENFYPIAGMNYHNYQYLSEAQTGGNTNNVQIINSEAPAQAKYWLEIHRFSNGLRINVTFHPEIAGTEEAEQWLHRFSDMICSVTGKTLRV
ncbi:amino acid adenylation domain-containing protein [Roseivirga sp. BDSF3-8]|uniref:amino acid adenylation domain-containing protein n=1 Tax=Roseivirga sp. BDSF3-8 TaxID=3241598 RepID=UPI003532139C